MGPKEVTKLVKGSVIKYIGITTSTRIKGHKYTVDRIDGNFVKHIGENTAQCEGHVGQYQLINDGIPLNEIIPVVIEPLSDAIKEVKEVKKEVETMAEPLPAIPAPSVTLPAVIPTSKDEVDFKKALKETQDLSSRIMQISLEQGQKLAQDMINTVESRLTRIEMQSKVLEVKVNESSINKLTTHAVPYLKRMVVSAKLGLPIMLVGPAGCGKTTAAQQLSEALGLPFYHNTITAGASETWFIGRQTPVGFQPGPLYLAYKNGGVYLGDEFDAGDANLLIMFNTMLENGHFYNPINGEHIVRHKDFVFIAACNTYGKGADSTYTGRNRLDAASLRRFAGSTLLIDYNDDIERAICPDDKLRNALQEVRRQLMDIGSQEIMSTGCLAKAFQLVTNGIAFKEVADSLAVSWPDDLKPIMDKAVKFYRKAA